MAIWFDSLLHIPKLRWNTNTECITHVNRHRWQNTPHILSDNHMIRTTPLWSLKTDSAIAYQLGECRQTYSESAGVCPVYQIMKRKLLDKKTLR